MRPARGRVMIIQCDNCKTRFKLNESAIKGAGVKVRCTKCESVFVVTRPDAEPPSVIEPIEAEAPEAPEASERPPEPKEPPSEDRAVDEEPPVDETDWGLGSDSAEEDETPQEEGPSLDESKSEEPPEEEAGWGLGLESSDEAEEESPAPVGDVEGEVAEEETPSSEEIMFDEPAEEEPAEEEPAEEEPAEEEPAEEEPAEEEPAEEEPAEEEADWGLGSDSAPEESPAPEDDVEGEAVEEETPSTEEITFEEPAKEEAGELSEDIDWSLDEKGEDGDDDFGDDVDWGLEEEEAGSVEDYTARLEKELGIDTQVDVLEYEPSDAVEEPAKGEEAPPALESALDETPAGGEDKESLKEKVTPPSMESGSKAPEGEEAPARIESAEEPVQKGGRRGIVISFIIILIGIAVLYFSGTFQSFLGPTASAQRTLEIKDLRGTFVQNEDIGEIYAVEGRIENISGESQEVLGVKITIFDKAGKALTSKTVSLARLVSSEELKSLSGEEIDRHYKDLSTGSIPPHGITPLMVIFSELPKGMDELEVEVVR